MQRVSSDAGFSLVEVLIALAVGAMAMTALSGMILLMVDTRERSKQAVSIESTLLQISAATSRLFMDTSYYAVARPGDFEIRSPSAEKLAIATISVGGALSVQYSQDETIVVDLSPFQSARLEYFASQGDNPSWRSEIAANSRPLAVRLVLRHLSWQWPLLLWVQGSASTGDSWDL